MRREHADNITVGSGHKCLLTWFLHRAKYHKLKYGTELNQGEMKMPSFESGK